MLLIFSPKLLMLADAQTRFETTSEQSNDPPLSKVNTFGSGEDNMKILELMEISTQSSYPHVPTVLGCPHQVRWLMKLRQLHRPIDKSRSGCDQFPPTDSTQIPIIDQPSTSSQPKKKQKSRRKQRKEAETAHAKTEEEEHFNTPSNDPLPSGEDIDETRERQGDDLMFDTGVLDDVEMPVEAKVDGKGEQSTKPDDSTAGEAVTTASVDDTTTIRPKDRGVVVQEPSESRVPQETQPSSSDDKGKAKLNAELIEEQKLARKQEEEANIALIESWENTQAMMEADRLLAKRLQSKEKEELTDEEKEKLFMELIEKRRKKFAALRAQEKRNGPPTKAQKRNKMSTYLKHMGGYTYK
ncbi:hypothetical protein Tco_0485175 [Tanacetum coccineum]